MGEPAHVFAPGWPGSPPRWTSSAKSGVGTALTASSRVSFTLRHGILNEVYYPRVDQACTRDLALTPAMANDMIVGIIVLIVSVIETRTLADWRLKTA